MLGLVKVLTRYLCRWQLLHAGHVRIGEQPRLIHVKAAAGKITVNLTCIRSEIIYQKMDNLRLSWPYVCYCLQSGLSKTSETLIHYHVDNGWHIWLDSFSQNCQFRTCLTGKMFTKLTIPDMSNWKYFHKIDNSSEMDSFLSCKIRTRLQHIYCQASIPSNSISSAIMQACSGSW